MKKCRKCEIEKELSEFYKHKQMFDGHLNICKDCTKKRVSNHRENNIEKIRKYDRERGKTEKRKNQTSRRTAKIRSEFPKYYKAHTAVGNAIRDGRLFKSKNCSWCGDEHDQIEGHHEDYSRPLEVVWLCSPCHKILHNGKCSQNEEMKRKIKIPIRE